MKPYSLLKKSLLALFISIPITLLSSLIRYGDKFPDGFSYVGFPFWREKSGGFAGIVVYDNLALFKNFVVWFLIVLIFLVLLATLSNKFKRGKKT